MNREKLNMPFFTDLLPKTNFPSTREGKKRALRDAYSKYNEANARGLYGMDCDRIAFVYAMCCMRVAKLLRVVTERQTVGVTMFFLSVAAQKLETVLRIVESRIALETRNGQKRTLVNLIEKHALAKSMRGLCTQGAIGVLVAAAGGDPSVKSEPGFGARVQAFLRTPRQIDSRVDKLVEHISRKSRKASA